MEEGGGDGEWAETWFPRGAAGPGILLMSGGGLLLKDSSGVLKADPRDRCWTECRP